MTPRGRREGALVPDAEFRSYYGRPILKRPTWKVPDVPGYLFLGGTAGASATMAVFADLTTRPELAGVGRRVAAGGALASVAALVHDLGRPGRFLNMLRVFKPTSPLSVGSWIIGPFSALATASAVAELTGRFPRLGRLAGLGSGVLGPAMCTYTAVLLADTAVPAWHEAYPELPVVFGGSALACGAGAALCVPGVDHRPPTRMGLLGAGMEIAALRRIAQRLGLVGEPYVRGRPGRLLKLSEALTAAGAGLSLLGRRSPVAPALAGTAYLAAGLCTRFGVFEAGIASAEDPRYVVLPQRQRDEARP
ncbi:NrfD/PsrC family molybdoenzyme membrane anchor subunit [Streptomyces sp. NRRL S-455]|uniref:NrfD/PsrC family molybdoenzyme membrane anchor subunit n=1 Tax=Streptomyces sp. NRRL S-455 TaxID=1463908 RepID=UPI000997CCDC|nr:NrfD/PsrC family molybdoenzyme membrane anchor subunit [Streptomyces sp. NRRL S-455]